jgi:2,3-bisphosphoglycerate-dependent phosphoglycerate mutase
MRRIILVRHGESIWNQDSKFTGWTNIPLTNHGRTEASQMAFAMIKQNIYPNVIFSSVLQRCIETSQLIQKEYRYMPIHTSWRLNEKHYGTLEGVPRQYIRDIYGDKFTTMMRTNYTMKPPLIKYSTENKYPTYKNCYFQTIQSGESKENVLQRLLPYYENDILSTLSENQTPLIVTHKHTARVLMKHVLKMKEEEFEEYELPKKIIVLYLNDTFGYERKEEISY